MDFITGGFWSIATIFSDAFPSSVPAGNGRVIHEAGKKEHKTKVWTYVSEPDGYHFGCLTEYSWAYFTNRIIHKLNNYDGKDTTKSYFQSEDYNTPDKRAYYAYTIGGVTQRIDGYYYGGVFFEAI